MPLSRSFSDMNAASTLYPPDPAGRRTGITSHENVLGTQGHQGDEAPLTGAAGEEFCLALSDEGHYHGEG
jgi:hypothetical protein